MAEVSRTSPRTIPSGLEHASQATEVWQLQQSVNTLEKELPEKQAQTEHAQDRLQEAQLELEELKRKKESLESARAQQATALTKEYATFEQWKANMETSAHELLDQEQEVEGIKKEILEYTSYLSTIIDKAVTDERSRLKGLAGKGAQWREQQRRKHEEEIAGLTHERDLLLCTVEAEERQLRLARRRVALTRCARAIFVKQHRQKMADVEEEEKARLQEEARRLAQEKEETKRQLAQQQIDLELKLRADAAQARARLAELKVSAETLQAQIQAKKAEIRAAEEHMERRALLAEMLPPPSESERIVALAEAAAFSDARHAAKRRAELNFSAQRTGASWRTVGVGAGARAPGARKGPWKNCGLTGELAALQEELAALQEEGTLSALRPEGLGDDTESETLFASLQALGPDEFLARVSDDDWGESKLSGSGQKWSEEEREKSTLSDSRQKWEKQQQVALPVIKAKPKQKP